MARLALDAAPEVASPRRFLATSPMWGVLAGLLLLFGDDGWVQTRWHPVTLAVTHALVLGMLGNVLFGSLLQFLPAAAGVRVRGGAMGARLLHGLLNLGTLLLVVALHRSRFEWATPAAALLAAAFGLLAVMTVPGLFAAHGQRLLRSGLALGIGGALVAAACGVVLALVLGGHVVTGWPLPRLVDVHATWGLVGWMLLTLAAVGRVVVPMFQGTPTPAAWLHSTWTIAVATALPLTSLAALALGSSLPLAWLVALAAASFALAVLGLQLAARRPRNAPLRAFWCAGALALAGCALALWRGDGLLAGALGIGVALPLFVGGMQLEIMAFLAWLDLHRRCGRGVRLPGVQRLLPDAARWRVLTAWLFAAALLCVAVHRPSATSTRIAAVALVAAYAGIGLALLGVRRRVVRFLARART